MAASRASLRSDSRKLRSQNQKFWHATAMAIAREQSAKLQELPPDTSLVRLWAEQDRRAGAHDLLAPVYGRFTEGFRTRDLRRPRRCSISCSGQGSDRRTLIVRIPVPVQHRGDAAKAIMAPPDC
jgi:predicted ATPase